MKANNKAFIKFFKLIAAIPTEWFDKPPPLGNFKSFKEYVPQTIINLTDSK